jgi:hypothetical protein
MRKVKPGQKNGAHAGTARAYIKHFIITYSMGKMIIKKPVEWGHIQSGFLSNDYLLSCPV